MNLYHTRLTEQEPGQRRIRLDLLTQLHHVHPEIVRLQDEVRTPDLLQQLSMGQELPRMAHQDCEQLVFGGSR